MGAITFLLIFLSSFFLFINKGTWDSVYEIWSIIIVPELLLNCV